MYKIKCFPKDSVETPKKKYLLVTYINIDDYKTRQLEKGSAWKLLPQVCKYRIRFEYAELFEWKSDIDYYDMLRNHWEYYAYDTPIWKERFEMHGAYICHDNETVIFSDENKMEEFYELYGYEPDEQKLEVQEKSIGSIKKEYNWKWFYDTYKKNGLFEVYEEELEEFDMDGLKY